MRATDRPQQQKKKRVLLVLAPWAAPYYPGLSISLLRSILLRAGIGCDLYYSNLLFSKIIGGDPMYEEQIAQGSLAELAFTPYYYDTSPVDAAKVLHEHFKEFDIGHAGGDLTPYTRLLDATGEFVERAVEAVRWEDYDIVGFSLMFQQTLSSLALARRVRQRHPKVTIVFGGPSCAEPMGGEILRSMPEVDYVVSGEADNVIVPLVEHIREQPGEPPALPGVLWREGDEVRRGPVSPPVVALDELPMPDYGPYFEQVEALGLDHFHPMLYIETSRGCWWGQKHHCTFCGIDDLLMEYRSKSPERVIDEILTLSRRHRITSFLTADNILDHRAYRTLLPELARLREEEEYDFSFFFELKANITREQVRLLREAGVANVQPGIESFSDHILELMDKGCTGINQLQVLKYFEEFDIQPVWNIIYMNPGERAEDYRVMTEMVPFMHHLPPLNRQSQIQMLLQRFNLYFENPGRYGIRDVVPQQCYRHLFPDPNVDLDKLAFFFEGRHDCHDDPDLHAAHAELLAALDHWRAVHRRDSLVQTRGPGFVEIRDRRSDEPGGEAVERLIVLDGLAAEVFAACDAARGEDRLLAAFEDRASREEVLGILDDLVARRLVYRSPARQYLNLPVLREPVNPRLGSPFDA